MNHPGHEALPQGLFLPTGSNSQAGQRFCLWHPPTGVNRRGSVLYLHPFAEELNTTRRVVAQQARALSASGYAVLQIDLTGCGDSFGDFSEATWAGWMEDAVMAHQWLRQSASGPMWLWGMRSGALLACELLKTLTEPAHLLLWQPVVSGQQMLQQFLRLQAASQWLGSGANDGQSAAQRLAQGQPVEIAGYTITPELAAGLAQATLRPPAERAGGRLIWLELTRQAEPALSPATEKELAAWRTVGWHVDAKSINAPAFWQTVGMEEAPALLGATLAAMTNDCPSKQAAPSP